MDVHASWNRARGRIMQGLLRGFKRETTKHSNSTRSHVACVRFAMELYANIIAGYFAMRQCQKCRGLIPLSFIMLLIAHNISWFFQAVAMI